MAPTVRYEIAHPKQVFVEGNDEIRIFGALLRHMNLTDVQIQSLDGIGNLRPSLSILTGLDEFRQVRSLAVVVDANSNRAARRDQIRNALANAGLPTPSAPLQMESAGELSVAYLIVPHDGQGTMIEDVCLESVRTDPAMRCVDDYFNCLDRNGISPPEGDWSPKSRAMAFLASRGGRTDPRLGVSAEQGVWPLDDGAFAPFRNLLTML